MNAKSIFDEVAAEIDRCNSDRAAVYEDYRKGVAAAEQEAARYKDEAGELAKRKAPLIATSRHRIKVIDEHIASKVGAALPKLKKALSDYLTAPANPALLEQLRVFTDFNVKMSRGELEAFVLKAADNYTALRAIQTVAANSGFIVSIPEGFEEDLETIAKLGRVPSMWCPAEYLSEGMEVLPDIPHFADDGSVAYTSNRPDSIYLLIQSGAFNAARRELTNISEKWSTAFVPKISELKPVKDAATGEIISTLEQHTRAVEAAAQMADIKSAEKKIDVETVGQSVVNELRADTNIQSVLEHYI